MIDDIVARYTLKFNDLASKGLLRVAGSARLMGIGLAAGATAAAAAVTASGAFVLHAAEKYSSFIDSLDETAVKANVSATYLKDLRYALGTAGVEAGTVDAGLSKFNVQLGQVATGTGGFAKKLQAIAPALANQLKGVTDGTLANQIAIGYLATLSNAQERATVGAVLYGKVAGPAFAGAAADIGALNKAFAQSRGLTGVITPEAIALASKYQDNLQAMKTALGAVQMAVGAAALPALNDLTQKFTEFVVVNRGAISSGLNQFFSDLAVAIKGIDFKALGDAVIQIIKVLPTLVNGLAIVLAHSKEIAIAWAVFKSVQITKGFFGGLKYGSDMLAKYVYTLGVVGKAGPQLSLTTRLAGDASKALFQLGTVGKSGPQLPSIARLMSGLRGIIPFITRIPALFGPIGLAVSGLAAGAGLVWANWDSIGPKLETASSGWIASLNNFANMDFAAAGTDFGNQIIAGFSSLNLGGILSAVYRIFENIAAVIMTIDFATLGANFGTIITNWIAGVDWASVGATLYAIFDTIGKILEGAVTFLGNLAFTLLTAAFSAAWDGVVAIASSAWDGISSIASSALDSILAKVNGFLSTLANIKNSIVNTFSGGGVKVQFAGQASQAGNRAAQSSVAQRQALYSNSKIDLTLRDPGGRTIPTKVVRSSSTISNKPGKR